MNLELTINCSEVEQLLQDRHGLDGPVRLTNVEYDEVGDLIAFGFEVEAEDSTKIGRFWDDMAFTEGLIEEAI